MNTAIAIYPYQVRNTQATALYDPEQPTYFNGQELMERFIDFTDRKDSTTKNYAKCIRRFLTWLADNGIAQPQREDIKAYRAHLENCGYSTGTQQQYLRAVKHFFRWTSQERAPYHYPNIADNLHAPKVRHDVHKRDEVPCDAIPVIARSIDRSTETGKRLYVMLMLTTQNGFRTVELSRANVGDIEQKGNDFYIYVWGKGHDEPDQKQYLLPEVKAAIDDYLAARTDKYTSKSPLIAGSGNRNKGGRMTTTTISALLKEMIVNAGYSSDRMTAHSLRHTSGTAAFKSGLDLYDVQHLMRHCDPATTEIYIHADNETEREKKGRRAIYDYIFNEQTASGILPELESEIAALSIGEQKQLLAQLKAQKGQV